MRKYCKLAENVTNSLDELVIITTLRSHSASFTVTQIERWNSEPPVNVVRDHFPDLETAIVVFHDMTERGYVNATEHALLSAPNMGLHG